MLAVRMGSQRLKHKNLREIRDIPLITSAIRKCLAAGVFDEIRVNLAQATFGEIASQEGVRFHLRTAELASNAATSERFIYEFLKAHRCDYLFRSTASLPC